MNDIEVELVDVVVQLAALRRLRAQQLRQVRKLGDAGGERLDLAEAMQKTLDAMLQLNRRRRELRAQLLRSRE
jgi:hypothetical protein